MTTPPISASMPLTLLALAGIATALAALLLATRLAARLGPTWLRPAHGPLFALAGLLVGAALVVASATGHSPLRTLSGWLGTAERGPLGALTLVSLGLAAALLLVLPLRLLFGLLRPRAAHRAPVPRLALLFGVAPDGTLLASARAALRWALGLTTLALLAALALPSLSSDPTPAAAALITLAMALAALADPAPATPGEAPHRHLSPMREPFSEVALLSALGHPPLVSTEPAVPSPPPDAAWPLEAALLSRLGQGTLFAVAAPPGGGKRSAAFRAAATFAARGQTTLWLGPPPDHLTGSHPPAASLDGAPPAAPPYLHLAATRSHGALTRGAPHPNAPSDPLGLDAPSRLGLIVVAQADHLSSDAVASLRYTLHRVSQRSAEAAPTLLVLGESASVVAVARALGAREPELVQAHAPLPTRAIARYLLAGPPSAATLNAHSPTSRAPRADSGEGVVIAPVALDRPRPAARYPRPSRERSALAAAAPSAARAIELLVPRSGPLGRLLRPDAPHATALPTPRLLVAMPGDRDAPESRDALARRHLRLALSEAPQPRARLAEVFTPRLVEAELAALAEAGLLVEGPAWRATQRRIEAIPTVSARLPLEALEPAPEVLLREPRSGRELRVPATTAAFHHHDGALVSLDEPATPEGARVDAAARFELRMEATPPAHDGHPGAREGILVRTAATSSTPIRRIRTRLLDTPRLTRLRFRGPRELELCDARVELSAHHRGVRFFQRGDGDEARVQTRLSPHAEPVTLRTEARLILLPADLSTPALHALTHALREVLPLFYANGPEEVGVTWAGPDELATLDPVADPRGAVEPASASNPALAPSGNDATTSGSASSLGRSALVLWDRHPEGLGAVRDLADGELEPLLLQVHTLLSTCACAAHCAACCETSSCTSDELPGSSRVPHLEGHGETRRAPMDRSGRLDRHAAARALEPYLLPASQLARPPLAVVVPLATAGAPFRRTA